MNIIREVDECNDSIAMSALRLSTLWRPANKGLENHATSAEWTLNTGLHSLAAHKDKSYLSR